MSVIDGEGGTPPADSPATAIAALHQPGSPPVIVSYTITEDVAYRADVSTEYTLSLDRPGKRTCAETGRVTSRNGIC
jgi:hypothetical protein